jgi:hypothetical protein
MEISGGIMHRSSSRHALSTLVIVLSILACAVPGQTVELAPILDAQAISTAVAGTAHAAKQQTQQASPATALVISTDTPIIPEVISSFETSLVQLADGSTQFRDYRAGVQILFPPNWLLVRPGEPEYYRALEKAATQNQRIVEVISALQDTDLNVFRVNAYDMHAEHVLYNVFPRVHVVFQKDDPRTLQEVETHEKTMIENSIFAGHKFLASDFQTTFGGLEILVFEDQVAGSDSPVYNKGTFFRVPTGIVIIDLYIIPEQKEALSPEYDKIIGSITLFSP